MATAQPLAQQIEKSGYRLQLQCDTGPMGGRCPVESLEGGPPRFADLITVRDSALLEFLCKNAEAFRGLANHPLIVRQLEARWLTADTYFQVLDLGPSSRPISQVWPTRQLDETELWAVASHIVAALVYLRELDTVHGALAPSTVQMDGDNVRLADFWWSHDVDGSPHHASLKEHAHDMWPTSLLPYLAPEVLDGSPPRPESDIYGLGATLYYALTGVNHRDAPVIENTDEFRVALLSATAMPLELLRPDLDERSIALIQNMLEPEPGLRVNLPLLESLINYLCQSLPRIAAPNASRHLVTSKSEHETDMYDSLISEGISRVLGGGPMSPIGPGKVASVQKSWMAGGRPWLTIAHPALEEQGDYRVVWVLRGASDNYAVLELEPGWMDEESTPDRTVVKVVGPRTIQTLTSNEFADIMPDLRADVVLRGVLDLSFVEQIFGKLPDYDDLRSGQQDAVSEGLTNTLNIGANPVSAKTTLSVDSRWEERGFHLIAIRDNERDEDGEFTVRWLVTSGDDKYAILMYPPGLSTDSRTVQLVIVKILDESTVATVTDKEFAKVKDACTATMNRYPTGHTIGIEEAFGSFLCTP